VSERDDLDNLPRSGEPSFIDWFAAKYPKTYQEMRFQYKIHLVQQRHLKAAQRGELDTPQSAT